ncbi:MAG: response regulator [bacterium]
MHILIVDDSLASRRLITHALRHQGDEGWTSSEAASGPEALLRVPLDSPDLILTDLSMPEMDGMEMVRVLKAAGQEIPIGMITAFDAPETRTEAQEAGIRFVLVKPFDPDILCKAVRMICDEIAKQVEA